METVPVGEEQPEEKEKHPQPDVENCAAVETVASTDCTDSRKEATGMDVTNATEGKEAEKENALPEGRPEAAEEAKSSQTTDGEDPLDERIIELNSSPEKMPTVGKTKEDAPKSPELEVFSVDDEEEHEEEDEEEEEMDDDEEEEFDEMDEEYEVYVEEKDSANPHNSMDDDVSKLDLSSDEYTDEEAEEPSPEKMGVKSASTPLRKASSSELEQDEEEEDDDDDVQIISYDEEIEEDDEEEEDIEEEEDEEESDPDEVRKGHAGKPKADSGSRRGLVGLLKRRVKYRSYKQKQLASIRKRTIRIINRRSMHVMEDNDDARALSSDCKVAKLSTDLHSVFAAPKQTGREDILPKAQEKTSYASAAITSTDNQNETKDTGIAAGGDKGDSKVQPKQLAAEAAEAVETPNNTISSTTSPSTDDKMPTATAVEVSEKIADSSDDAVSVLSSSTSVKKSVTASTPTVNSSASTEAVEQKESTTDTTSKASKEVSSPEERSSLGGLVAQHSQKEDVSNETNQISSSPKAIAEPTADDVMEGIDDFMEHTGSEGDEEKQHEKEFNEDLTFQMDVDPPSVENSSSFSNKEKNDQSAIDLTSTSEQPKEKGEGSLSSEAHPTAASNLSTGPSSTLSVDVTSSKGAQVDLHDKTVVTSTPVTNQKKAQPKRADQGQEAASSSLEVKQEHDVESDGSEAQNLSKQKSSGTRAGGNSAQPAQKAVQSDPPASRKRRRSVETEEDRQTGGTDPDSEESIEPAKKLKLEVEANYPTHERAVNDYIETTQNTSVDEIQNHTDALVKEIQDLNDKIRETEISWNNLLHLKKVKEEILLRLNRRKHVIGIMDTQLGEVSVYSHIDSSNLSRQHHQQQGGRSSSVGPRPPTPPPEVEIRPASVTSSMHYGFNASSSGVGSTATNGGDKAGHHFGNHSRISNRRSSSNSVQTSGHTASKSRNAKDTNSFVSQFNSSNNAVTMVPLPNTASMMLHARASMNSAELAKEKSTALQIQRQILSKPMLANHQQILNNLAMSAGLTGSSSSTGAGSGSNNSSTALLNGHHNPGGSNSAAQQQLQIGRQGMRKDVSSIIADYRQKHPEYVPRRGRRLKNPVGNSASNNGTSGGSGIGAFGDGGAISLTALSGGKSPANVRPNSTDSVANRISELLAAAETSRPSSNDSSQSNSNLLSSLMSASGAANSSQQFFKDVLAQFAKMSQNEQSLLSNLQLLSSNATAGATNTVSSPQQSPQQQHHHHQGASSHHQQQSTMLSKGSLPEVTLHPVMNSTAHSDVLGGSVSHGNGSLTGANLSAVNSSTNSLLHGILTKSANRPGQTTSAAAAAAAAAAVGNFNTFSPTLARLLTVPERMNTQSSSTVTSGALANLQTNSLTGGLNLSKNINEISITPVVGSNFQQTLLAQQQQQTLQRLHEQQLYNLDDEADDSADKLIIDEGDDMGQRDAGVLHGGKRRGAEINENEVPQCQGCKKQEAKFVCAGCGNQWYCSRACQVNAWDDHSEVCSG